MFFESPSLPFGHLGIGSVFIAPDPASRAPRVFIKEDETHATVYVYAGVRHEPNPSKFRLGGIEGGRFPAPRSAYVAFEAEGKRLSFKYLEEVFPLEVTEAVPRPSLLEHFHENDLAQA